MTVNLQEAEEYNRHEAGGDITYMQVTKATVLWQIVRGLTVDGKLGPVTRADIDSAGDPSALSPAALPPSRVPYGARTIFVVEMLSEESIAVTEVTE